MVRSTWEAIHNTVLAMEPDIDKVVQKQARASARRGRKAAQEIKVLCQQLRKELQEAVQ